MKIVVLKFGGTSVGTIERIKNVAKIVIGYLNKRHNLVLKNSTRFFNKKSLP